LYYFEGIFAEGCCMTETTNVVTIHGMNLGSNLRKFRQEAELTQEELAKLSGVDQQVISAIEKRDSKSSGHAPALARALGKTVDELLGAPPQAQPKPLPGQVKVADLVRLIELFGANDADGREAMFLAGETALKRVSRRKRAVGD
jgi:transcriptional regulator with XRE-family HTH domain